MIDTSHGKRSAYLDLDDPAGADRLRALAPEPTCSCRATAAGSMDRRGFGAEALADGHRGLVHVSVNCYGPRRPLADRPGWEQLAQIVTGLVLGHAPASPRPEIVPGAICDYTTGYLAALGAAAALRRRALEGGSYAVRGQPLPDRHLGRRHGPRRRPVRRRSPGHGPDRDRQRWGTVRHLPPVPQLSRTPARWARPPARIGEHAASF